MDVNRMTEKVQEALGTAQRMAVRLGHQQVDVEHLLAALLEQENGLAGGIIEKAGGSPGDLLKRIHSELDRLPRVTVNGSSAYSEQVYITGRLNRLLAQA
ncbi:MAG TPA: type VI secretion system ATPase TssH, partial [Firmicutes bacterium]|nr:type VI secretion system ATPase TssH [Bacillota bacterium]